MKNKIKIQCHEQMKLENVNYYFISNCIKFDFFFLMYGKRTFFDIYIYVHIYTYIILNPKPQGFQEE